MFVCMSTSLQSTLSYVLVPQLLYFFKQFIGPSNAESDKKSDLAMMDFSEEEINLATSRLGMCLFLLMYSLLLTAYFTLVCLEPCKCLHFSN